MGAGPLQFMAILMEHDDRHRIWEHGGSHLVQVTPLEVQP